MKHTLMVALVFALLAAGVAAAAKAPDAVPGALTISAEDLIDLKERLPDLVLVDSRRKDEFKKGHIEGSFNILDTEMTKGSLLRVTGNNETPVLFYCNGERCLRSALAAKKAKDWGYRQVFWFRGGWKEWRDKNLPVSK